MTFWQENYGFVKDVYDFRLQKYQEWMDKLEAIVGKVMAPNVQYTYKEFKVIKDSLSSLTRDLEKEGMKAWLDMMLEKVAVRVGEEAGLSAKDKEFKLAEKKKLETLIDRHDKLMPSTIDAQQKVEIYARCYAFGDEISPVLKTLQEMHHLAVKEIHPHNMKMLDEQIEKSEKVITTVEAQRDNFEELRKRGAKLIQTPNVAPFLGELLEKLDTCWKDANEQSQNRLQMLKTSSNDWETYDELRSAIIEPLEKLEGEYKKYRKFYDPVQGLEKLTRRKEIFETHKKAADEMMAKIKMCYTTIMILAGDEKKEFLDKEVNDVEEKRQIITKCEDTLNTLFDYNGKLTAAVTHCRELDGWAKPTREALDKLCTDETITPEDRTKEILTLQEVKTEKEPQLAPLDEEYRVLLTDEDMEKSETAKKTMQEWKDCMEFTKAVCETIEHEAASISTDQRLYADYLCSVKDFKPWMDDAEKEAKKEIAKPDDLETAMKILEEFKSFDSVCGERREKLDAANKARETMEKQSTVENECGPLGARWDEVKKSSSSRIERAQALVTTWTDLTSTSEELATKTAEVHKQESPDLESLEKVYNNLKELVNKKKELMTALF